MKSNGIIKYISNGKKKSNTANERNKKVNDNLRPPGLIFLFPVHSSPIRGNKINILS